MKLLPKCRETVAILVVNFKNIGRENAKILLYLLYYFILILFNLIYNPIYNTVYNSESLLVLGVKIAF